MHRIPSQRTRVAGPVGSPVRPASPTLRASNQDRQRVLDRLREHYVAGRLTSEELEERIERGVAARTLGDLDALVADLPEADVSPDDGATPDWSHHSPHWRRHDLSHGGKQGFRAHAVSYLLVISLLVAIWALTTPGGYFWPVWPMLGWGIGLASHGLGLRAVSGQRSAVSRC